MARGGNSAVQAQKEWNMERKVVLLLGIILILILAACGTPEPADLPAEAAPDIAGVTEATVTIVKQAFQPHTLVVATGASVTWQNDDSVAHTVTSSEGWFDSGQLAAGESFVHQFDKPGTYRYGCTNHPSMEGVVIVLAGGGGAPTLFEGKAVSAAFTDSCSGCHGSSAHPRPAYR